MFGGQSFQGEMQLIKSGSVIWNKIDDYRRSSPTDPSVSLSTVIPRTQPQAGLTLYNLLHQHLESARTTATILTPPLESPTSNVILRVVLAIRDRFKSEQRLCSSIHSMYSRPKLLTMLNGPIYFTTSDSYDLDCMLFQFSHHKTQRLGYRAGF